MSHAAPAKLPRLLTVFDELLEALRNSPEWAYVDRDVDIRLVREPARAL